MLMLLFCLDLLIPLLMLAAGWLLRKHPPARISGVIGYRTARSMVSMDSWRFAQADCGRRWWRAGWWMLLPSAVAHLPLRGCSEDAASVFSMILMALQTLVMIAVTLQTERALRRAFTPDGQRKESPGQ